MIRQMRAAIFDLDGVIVDTARYHYLAWKRLANQHGVDFTESDNERLKGVSRTRSLEILLEICHLSVDDAARASMAALKNDWYVEYIRHMDARDLLPGVADYIHAIRQRRVRTAIGSASKNTPLIIERLDIAPLFDVIVDGNKVTRAKPDPEVFLCAARELGVAVENCVVFEDAEAGIEAARRAGMGTVGIGRPAALAGADMVIAGLDQLALVTA